MRLASAGIVDIESSAAPAASGHAAVPSPAWRGSPNVRLPIPIAAFRAQGRLSQLSAINRHNQQLFDLLVGAQQNRWGYRKTERLGGLEVQDHLELGRKLNG